MIFCRPAVRVLRRNPKRPHANPPAFTILELLVAMAVMAMVGVLVVSVMSQTSQAVRTSNERVESFQSAREGFDALTRQLSQATLNTYYDYYNSSRQPRTPSNAGTFTPDRYGRQSDLHFIAGNNLVPSSWQPVTQAVFFQTPMGYAIDSSYSGLENLMNVCGFFVAFTSDGSEMPSTLETSRVTSHFRFRLYRMSQPTENLSIYKDSAITDPKAWFETPLADSAGNATKARQNGIYPIADNVVALVIWPKLPPSQENYDGTSSDRLSTDFTYDSRCLNNPWTASTQPVQMHQLPPLLDIAMVTVDEVSAARLLEGKTTAAAGASALGMNFSGKFQVATTSRVEGDLKSLQEELTAKGVKCRIFRATISLRGSKWSSN